MKIQLNTKLNDDELSFYITLIKRFYVAAVYRNMGERNAHKLLAELKELKLMALLDNSLITAVKL